MCAIARRFRWIESLCSENKFDAVGEPGGLEFAYFLLAFGLLIGSVPQKSASACGRNSLRGRESSAW